MPSEAHPALRSSEALLESFQEFAWVVDARCRLVACNAPLRDYFTKQFGTEMKPGVASADVLPPGRAERFDAFYTRAMESGPFTETWTLADERVVAVTFSPVREGASVVGVAALAQDVTARTRAEEALRRSEAKLRAFLDNSAEGVLFADRAGTLTYRSGAYARLNGYSNDERVGRSGFAPIVPDDLPAVLAVWEDVASRPGAVRTVEYRFAHKDGRTLWFESTIQNQLDTPALGEMVIVTRDVTEKKRLEAERDRLRDELFQAQKMEAVGTLAGGVAHDFNNILGGVLGSVSLLQLEPSLPEHCAAELRGIADLGNRGADLAKQLLGFARKGSYRREAVDLPGTVSAASALFARTRKDIVVTQEHEAGLPPALVDSTQLHQVLLNLLLNAGHAMPSGGAIALRSRRVAIERDEAEARGVEAGTFVELTVADTGSGIAPEHLAHVFEPFFTTRKEGEGTGLGLASVYGIVRGHGGIVRVTSELGVGTTFTVLLPASAEAPPRRPSPPPAARPSGAGTVLVVDDEEPMRKVCARMLEQLGYTVLVAKSGEAGVEIVKDLHASLAFVLLDLTMPGIGGAKAYDAMHALAPALRVLLMSGFTAEGQPTELLARGAAGFLQKPFDYRAFAAKVGEIEDHFTS